jgi:hypothetical protein
MKETYLRIFDFQCHKDTGECSQEDLNKQYLGKPVPKKFCYKFTFDQFCIFSSDDQAALTLLADKQDGLVKFVYMAEIPSEVKLNPEYEAVAKQLIEWGCDKQVIEFFINKYPDLFDAMRWNYENSFYKNVLQNTITDEELAKQAYLNRDAKAKPGNLYEFFIKKIAEVMREFRKMTLSK